MPPTKSEGRRQKSESRRTGAAGLVLLLVLGAARAATLTGVVLDAATWQPVSYAAVSAPNLDLNTIADSAGAFALKLEPGLSRVTVAASRVGYEEKRWEKVDVSRPATLYLRPSPVRLEGISVSAFRTPSPLERSGPVSIIEGRNAEADGRLSLAELLWVSPSVISKDYGNLTTIGLRGANTEQTLILLDGVRLNSAQDNLFDLTTLPLTLPERIEVVRGNSSALYGANSIGGLVNVVTPEPDRFGVNATAGIGSFGKRYLQATHSDWSAPLGYVVTASLNRMGDSFSYRDTLDSVHERVNSDINSQDVMAKGVFAQGAHRVSLLGEYNVTRRGEPGPTSWPADSARMDDYRGIVHLSYDLQEADNARLESRLYHHQSWRHFWNPDTLSWVNDTHVTTVSGIMAKQTAHFTRWATVIAGLEGGREQFQSTAIGTPLRWTGAGWAEARLRWLSFDIVPMARFDWLGDSRQRSDSTTARSNTRVVSPKLSLSYSGPGWLDLYASAGRSFRAPTFNELYWPEDPWTKGNPQLKPEWATSVDFNTSVRYASFLTGRLGLWHSFLTDLIQWQPDSAWVYRPVNLDTATITGGELELALTSRHAGIVGNATYMLANSHDMDLIYRPRLSFVLSPWAGWGPAQLTCDVRYTGQRYTMPDTLPPNGTNSLPSFMLFDVGLAITPTFGRVGTALRGGIRNLFDRQYEVMRGYPILGRNWYVELELKL
ncbi:MAG: TonB-dependent receptor [candidate division WOR-3 bacterium]|nr:TonB-dependent receptor [candidate division WOR-3 bacterium]